MKGGEHFNSYMKSSGYRSSQWQCVHNGYPYTTALRYNVLSIRRRWEGVKFPEKKHYVTLEWPLSQANVECTNYWKLQFEPTVYTIHNFTIPRQLDYSQCTQNTKTDTNNHNIFYKINGHVYIQYNYVDNFMQPFYAKCHCLVFSTFHMTVSTRHVCDPFAIDRERFAAGCPCPHGRSTGRRPGAGACSRQITRC